jgi:hypothetical protein
MDEAAHVFYGSSMPILTSLGILQAQFAAFQDTLGALSSDVKDALAQLHALRTAQNRTDRSVAELEGVVGRGRARRGRGRGTGTPLQADPERTLVQSVAAIEALLARDSPSHLPPSVNLAGQASSQSDSSVIPTLETPLPAVPRKSSFVCPPCASTNRFTEYADASIHACPLSPTSSLPHYGLRPVDWRVDPGKYIHPFPHIGYVDASYSDAWVVC